MELTKIGEEVSREGLYPGVFSGIEDTPEGFAIFFSMIAQDVTGEPLVLTEHGHKWVETAYAAHDEGMGAVIEAFRGASKSVVSNGLVAFRIGQQPAYTNMVVRATHGAAVDTGRVISNIIEANTAWPLFFPYVLPGSDSWNLNAGYNVIDTRISAGIWAQMMAGRGASKTLMVTPLASKGIRGRRVNGILLMDDLHQDENSDSPVELNKVLSIWNEGLAPIRMPDCWTLLIGTPVAPNDLLQTLKGKPKLYKSIQTPIRKADGTPQWPELYPEEIIKQKEEEDITGGPGFAKEYMCDLSLAQSRTFDYMTYPAEQIHSQWKRRGGLDYASIEGAESLKYRSHASLVTIAFNPDTGDWVVADVLVGQVRQSKVESWILDTQAQSPNYEYTNIEIDGKGAEFFAIMARNPVARLKAERTGGLKKYQRYERGLQPPLQSRQLKVSDGNSPGLAVLREALDNYPNIDKRGAGLDVLDALYWAYYDEMIKPSYQQARFRKKEKKVNPFYKLAKM